jgi:hypothetical protein
LFLASCVGPGFAGISHRRRTHYLVTQIFRFAGSRECGSGNLISHSKTSPAFDFIFIYLDMQSVVTSWCEYNVSPFPPPVISLRPAPLHTDHRLNFSHLFGFERAYTSDCCTSSSRTIPLTPFLFSPVQRHHRPSPFAQRSRSPSRLLPRHCLNLAHRHHPRLLSSLLPDCQA